ncbi:hypothetical protein ACEWY4_010543 [Coilia grayii]|uniref:Circadian-associated transcriptional repressor n=1 Tax=Coilia grayii TaxID=363190 RepID=A0ABD1K274_9TELE
MSSSDSDYSIDWLASDEEDAECEQGPGPDCVRRATSSCSSATSSLMAARGGRRCPSPPVSGDSWGSPCTRQHLPDGGSEDSNMMREEEEEEEEKQQEEEEEERSTVGRSDDSSCSSPSSCTGSHDGAESHMERLGSDTDKPRHPRGADTPKKRLVAHKRVRTSEGPHQEEERPLHCPQTDKDRLFTSKCMELQSYIPPLSSILNGLRSGRYRERLSSFQESVAMDRIQRIMGVLQNPHMGERYVNIILKVEEMLKSWFPHIKPLSPAQHPYKQTPLDDTQPSSKKQKLSPAALARPLVMATAVSGCVHPASGGKAALCVRDLGLSGGPYSATSLKWLHTSPICSLTAEQAQGGASLRVAAPATAAAPHHDQDLTQDNAVSSSTDAATPPAAVVVGNGKAGGARGKSDSGPAGPPLRQAPPPSPSPPPPPPPPPPLPPPASAPSARPPLGKINAPCLERLLKSTESIITRRGSGGVAGSGWS